MESWQTTQLGQFNYEASCFKVIKLILTGVYINETEILSVLKCRLAKMYQLLIMIYNKMHMNVYA